MFTCTNNILDTPTKPPQHTPNLLSPADEAQPDSTAQPPTMPALPEVYQLLVNHLPSILLFNLRILNSRSCATITRVPLYCLVNDEELLKDRSGIFNCGDIDKGELEELMCKNVSLKVVQ